MDIKQWLQINSANSKLIVTHIPFMDLNAWILQKETGNIVHNSGKFFSIEGLKIKTNFPNVQSEWKQPIINQPEVGILGIIMRQRNKHVEFLMQAKVEPGNINTVQIAPTMQATWSNYTQIHNGQKPCLLGYFLNNKKSQIIIDYLESEQGARFFKKRN
jgi:oxidase EvaA